MLLKDLKAEYTASLEGTPFANPRYRIEKSNGETQKITIGNSYHLCGLEEQYSSTGLDTLVQKLYNLSSTEKINDVALQVHESIMRKFKEIGSAIWPPAVRDLEQQDDVLPKDLEKFLLTFVAGDVTGPVNAKISRLVLSLGQDLCRVATRGHWKLTKRIFLCMTLRHMFRSSEIITLISRMGHRENYSF